MLIRMLLVLVAVAEIGYFGLLLYTADQLDQQVHVELNQLNSNDRLSVTLLESDGGFFNRRDTLQYQYKATASSPEIEFTLIQTTQFSPLQLKSDWSMASGSMIPATAPIELIGQWQMSLLESELVNVLPRMS